MINVGNSNTTNVKVKLCYHFLFNYIIYNSNTTNVKVKHYILNINVLTAQVIQIQPMLRLNLLSDSRFTR